MSRLFLSLFFCFFFVSLPYAETPKEICHQAGAYFIVGKIVSEPHFAPSWHYKKGYELSHTTFYVKDNKNNERYKVALDNVFASDYTNGKFIPPSYKKQLKKGSMVKLCGQLFGHGKYKGIHWTHVTCGHSKKPSGFIITETSQGKSISGSRAYCNLWE